MAVNLLWIAVKTWKPLKVGNEKIGNDFTHCLCLRSLTLCPLVWLFKVLNIDVNAIVLFDTTFHHLKTKSAKTLTKESSPHVACFRHLGDVVVILLYLPPPAHQLVGVCVVDVRPPAPLIVVHTLGHILVPLSVCLRSK